MTIPSRGLVGLITTLVFLLHFTSATNHSYHPDLKAWAKDPKSNNNTCIPRAIVEFPSDGLTYEDRVKGWYLVHIFVSLYLFILLGKVCDKYFVPSIEKICLKLQLSSDVAGATFMAAATSSPELFINLVGTFVTKGDIGVGTVVGSAVFNVLAVPAACGLFILQPKDMEWWPISRDCVMYAITVLCLILFIRDGQINSFEALLLVIFYFLYILVMIYNKQICNFLKQRIRKRNQYRHVTLLNEKEPLFQKPGYLNNHGSIFVHSYERSTELLNNDEEITTHESLPEESSPMIPPPWQPNTSIVQNIWNTFVWPTEFILAITIPDCRRRPTIYPLTFLMCILWIGIASYLVAWMITIVGDTLDIPDSVMGITFLAAGTSVPEAVSSVLVTRQGKGEMGISNSIGSNVFDILLCLGLPWLLKSAFLPQVAGEHYIQMNSRGITFSIMTLFITLVLLYVVFLCNRFRLERRVGVVCLLLYVIYLIFASFSELNYFGIINPPMCSR